MGAKALMLLMSLSLASGVRAEDTAESTIAVGKTLYESVGCWACHGFSGQGASSRGIASGPRIDAKIYPREAFLLQLRSPMRDMPPYTRSVLSDEEVNSIYAYLESLPTLGGRSGKVLPKP